MNHKVLIVDDDRGLAELVADVLRSRTFEPTVTTTAQEALAHLEVDDFDIVVTDVRMRGLTGLELCERVALNRPDIPVVVMTAFGSLESAVGAIRAGAWDFVTKPFDNEVLVMAVERACKHRTLSREVKRLQHAVELNGTSDEIVGQSPAMRALVDLIGRVADVDATVLLTGESGTGKEVIARAIHARSARHEKPFVAVNCAAMPEALLESELFGHTKGAFTDARTARKGLFLQAEGGTLLLDEIGDLPMALQVKLLRVLQERVVRPVGGDTETPFDVRIVAATHRDLEVAVAEKRFREDLYYRLHVIPVALPPLRARGGDVLLLAQHFLEKFASRRTKRVTGLSPEAADRLLTYAWPGNVRELQNAMERAVALTRFEEITVDDLPEKIRAYRRSLALVRGDEPGELVPMDEVERRYILRVMEAVGGNKTLAAQILGFDRTTLYRKLDRYAHDPRAAH